GTATGANVASDGAPHFSHLAMCEESANPPLGWVLSDRTRSSIEEKIFAGCGNPDELAALKKALGQPAPASAGTTTSQAKNTPR
ncbi:MAG TPA: hypothetical protein VE665_02895, partial [Hyphomicrobiaceae bacterium]|nr:hypothetical protein [Hyphomicrobiaceae bacterium]